MDLKIKDVAELLDVSETTIRRWLKDGKLPAYQLNQQYRFNRGEIEDWMMKCKIKRSPCSPFAEKEACLMDREASEEENIVGSRVGTQQFSLYRAMHKGGLLTDFPAKNKTQVIRSAMQTIAPGLGLDPKVISTLLLDREVMMSTALNSGIAVPHPRDIVLGRLCSDAVITVCLRNPIDYGALDGQPVKVLFFLFSSSDKTHLHLLSKLAHLGRDISSLEFFFSQPSLEAMLAYIKEWECNMRRVVLNK